MSGYIGREPLTPAVQRRQSFIATASQTDFSFMYQAGYLDVFLNGVKNSAGAILLAIFAQPYT